MSSASTSSPSAGGEWPDGRCSTSLRSGMSCVPAARSAAPWSAVAPCPWCDRPCRRGTASLQMRPSGGLRYPLRVDGTHSIGIDLGGTKILAAVVSHEGEIVRRHERETPHDSQDSVVRELEAAVSTLLGDEVSAIGFGVPSPIDLIDGVVVECVNLPLKDFPLGAHMSDRFGLPVGLDNDANSAAIGEWRAGAGRGVEDMVMLTLGTGLGGGVISGGRPFRGHRGAGVELGHVVIVHEGRPCQGACRGHGHLEPYVTGLAATLAAKEAFGPSADAHRLIRLANEGDGQAREILADIGRYLGSAMGSFANIFAPQLIVIGGGFGVAGWEHLVPSALEIMEREALRPMRDWVRVVPADLGTAAGSIGAAFVGFYVAEGPPPSPSSSRSPGSPRSSTAGASGHVLRSRRMVSRRT